jgi:tetratricopeptide (TPR) repeat protein
MLPPTLMRVTKNRGEDGRWKIEDGFFCRGFVFHPLFSILHPRCFMVLALALGLAGCSPSGPRALLKGKKQLERGNYTAAVEQLKIATSLLSSNAQAWNYLGVACQHAGQPAEAAAAYQRALAHNRDLMEAHYNLGCLWLEQNKPDAAASEFIAYTLRRSKAPEGWLKLGLAQLQAHDVAAAEKSFSTALYLSPDNAEALNGLGLARVERGRPGEAMQFFTAATKANPDYAPAWLNLATVALQHLHDNTLALQNYRAYLALKPRPANWEAVNDFVNSLEVPAKPAAANENQAPAPESRTLSAPAAARPAPLQRTQTVARASTVPPRQATPAPPTVKVQPEPVIAGAPAAEPSSEPSTGRTGTFSRLNPLNWFRSAAPETNQLLVITSSPPPVVRNTRVAVTPLAPASPAPASPAPAAPVAAAPKPTPLMPASLMPPKPVKIVQPAVPTYPRYVYLSPPRPKAGDRRTAANAFTRAREFEQASRWQDALQAYREATEQDPSWFEARYNYGVIAYRLRNYSQALAAYETALSIQPESVDARYNFALALKAEGYVTDAVKELEKILATNPNEVRAHLALGNIYTRQLYDPARARQHYLKVLQLDPGNSEAPEIHFWLSSNPG